MIERKMFILTLPVSLVPIFCEFQIDSKVIFKNIEVPEDNLQKGCQGVNELTDSHIKYSIHEYILITNE